MIPGSIRSIVVVVGAIEFVLASLYTIFVFFMRGMAHTASQQTEADLFTVGSLVVTVALLMLVVVGRDREMGDWPIFALGCLCLASPTVLILATSM